MGFIIYNLERHSYFILQIDFSSTLKEETDHLNLVSLRSQHQGSVTMNLQEGCRWPWLDTHPESEKV